MHPIRTGRLAAALLAALAAGHAAAEEPKQPVDWTAGPAQVDVGSSVAEVALPEGLLLAGQKDTQRLLESMGNTTSGDELALVAPRSEAETWFVIFEYDRVGYVRDDEKNEIDADALLDSIKEGTERANEERRKQGHGTISVVGWDLPPRYDPVTHNLTWAIRGRGDDGHEVVNYNVRVLGRDGVMSVTLVDDAAGMQAARSRVEPLLAGFAYKRGKTYAEWVPGDKVAEYGLTALVAAGAGAAAVKTGLFAALAKLLAKGGKLVVVALAAAGAVLVKGWKALTGRRDGPPVGPPAA
jgi:uncharacterized membrane-anchored protein